MRSHVNNFDKVITVRTKVTGQNDRTGEGGFEDIQGAYEKDVKLFVKTLKEYFHLFDQGLAKEITDMKEVFNQMETGVAKCSIERKYFDIEKKELFIENDRLLEHIICQDVMCIPMHTDVVHNCVVHANDNRLVYAEMEQSYIDEYSRVLELETELSKKKNMVEKLLVYVGATCPDSKTESKKVVGAKPMNKQKKVRFGEPKKSTSNTSKQSDSQNSKITNQPLLTSTGVKCSTSASESKPSSNTKK
ncbi:hypothetical protein Tco_0580682 [Tanacetum coccineum]